MRAKRESKLMMELPEEMLPGPEDDALPPIDTYISLSSLIFKLKIVPLATDCVSLVEPMFLSFIY